MISRFRDESVRKSSTGNEMQLANIAMPKRVLGIAALLFSLLAGIASISAASQTATQPPAQTPAAAKPVGTIKSISGNTITLTTDAGSDVTILVQDATKLLRVAPGQKDLKDAAPIQLQSLQPGDRILVLGRLADDGKSVLA